MVNAKLADITAVNSLAGGELIYVEQGGNSRRATLGKVGALLMQDTGETSGLAHLGLTAGTAGKAVLAGATEQAIRTTLDLEYLSRSLLDFGAAGDGSTNDDVAVAAALATGEIVNGAGLTYAVSAVPSDMLRFSNAAFEVSGIVYPTADFMRLELSKISSTPFYADWVQDKACTHKNKIIVPFQLAHGHTYDTTRIAWTISFDDGNTFSAPEIILDKHADPANYGYNVFAAGIKDNRFVMVVEERNVSDSSVNALTMYDRVLDWSSQKTNGIALTSGSAASAS